MGKYYGYTCVTSVKYDRSDKEARKNSKQYQLLVSKCKEQGIELEEVYSDVLTDFYRDREELMKLCLRVQYEDVIVMDTIFALGTTMYDINDNVMLVNGSCLFKVLTPYEGIDFSTTNDHPLDFDKLNDRLVAFARLIGGSDGATLLPFSYYKGRPKIPLTDEFVEIYWLYENFFIDENTAINNKIIKMAKASFHSMCRLYEKTDHYKEDLNTQHKLHQTGDKPKRSGKVPDWFTEEFMSLVDDAPDLLQEICMQHNIFPLSPLEYNRWKVKYTIGRKGLFETNKRYFMPEMAESLKNKE